MNLISAFAEAKAVNGAAAANSRIVRTTALRTMP